MNDVEIAWLAGLLEGEGSFVSPPPSDPKRARVTMQSTDKDIVNRVASMFGLSYVQTRRHEQKRNATWKPSYAVSIRGKKAESLMRAVYPFMGERRKVQIRKALESVGQGVA